MGVSERLNGIALLALSLKIQQQLRRRCELDADFAKRDILVVLLGLHAG
jgi:hypothetical protein